MMKEEKKIMMQNRVCVAQKKLELMTRQQKDTDYLTRKRKRKLRESCEIIRSLGILFFAGSYE
jgi:hypothetical protein